MYWIVFLLIVLGVTVTFVILQRYTQNKTLWITDMSATIWFSVLPEQFEIIKQIIEEYNNTLPKNTGIVVVGVNFDSEESLIDRLEDSMYTFSTIQVPDMIFLSEQSLKKLHRKKLVITADKDKPEFKIFPIMASVDVAYINTKRFQNIKRYAKKRENFPDLEDSSLSTFDDLEKAANVYTRVQIDENLVKSDGIKPFLTVNSLNRFFATAFMQLGGDTKNISATPDIFYKVWRFIVKCSLLGYLVVVDEDKQFFNKIDTVKSPVVLGVYAKNNYVIADYPKIAESVKKILPITQYGMSFVSKPMNDTKKSILTYFCDWFVQQQKNVELSVYYGCLPIMNDTVNTSKEVIDESISLFALNIDMEEAELSRITKRAEIVRTQYESADSVIDYNVFNEEVIGNIVSKMSDYIAACQHRLDHTIDYDNPDEDTVGTMYSRKAFDNWVNYFDL